MKLNPPAERDRYLLIACEVMYREFSYLAALSDNTIDIIWLSQGLHDIGAEKMSSQIQQTLDNIPQGKYRAVLLGYALCNNGIENIVCKTSPMIVPKAHDCITLFLGSKELYRDYFDKNPGTYFLSSGWLERDETNMFDVDGTIGQKLGLNFNMQELIEQYGKENAAYIADTMGDFTKNYSKIAYIKAEYEDNSSTFASEAEKIAADTGFEFEIINGDLSLMRSLLAGNWDSRFIQIEPGETIKASFDENIIKSCSE
ncbi:MAG: DUF1638 domain-containing protein [Planctomycetota bacterium]|jgi:hypothetical protein